MVNGIQESNSKIHLNLQDNDVGQFLNQAIQLHQEFDILIFEV
jgi:hypothetical protein